MSIEVRIPKDITEYQEKIMFGLSIRKLIAVTIVALVGGLVFYLGWIYYGKDVATYASTIVAFPILAVGFLKPKGFYFEKYLSMVLRHQLGLSHRKYISITEIEETFNKKGKQTQTPKNNDEKRGESNAISKQKKESKNIRECSVFEVTEKDRKRKSKEANRKIKAAKQEYRREKQSTKKAAKKRGGTTNSTADNQIQENV